MKNSKCGKYCVQQRSYRETGTQTTKSLEKLYEKLEQVAIKEIITTKKEYKIEVIQENSKIQKSTAHYKIEQEQLTNEEITVIKAKKIKKQEEIKENDVILKSNESEFLANVDIKRGGKSILHNEPNNEQYSAIIENLKNDLKINEIREIMNNNPKSSILLKFKRIK